MSPRSMLGTVLVGVLAALGLLAGQGRLVRAAVAEAANPDTSPPAITAPIPATTRSVPTGARSIERPVAPSVAIPAPDTTVAAPPLEPGVLIIGDSILEGLGLLDRRFGPGTVYDTQVSRSILELPQRLDEHRDAGPLPHRIVVHLGTNGWWPDAGTLLDEVVEELDGHRVVLIDVAVDRPWAKDANQGIRATARHHDHVELVGWQAAARPDLLRTDGVHPNLEGFGVLHELIAEALGFSRDAGPPNTALS